VNNCRHSECMLTVRKPVENHGPLTTYGEIKVTKLFWDIFNKILRIYNQTDVLQFSGLRLRSWHSVLETGIFRIKAIRERDLELTDDQDIIDNS
jgi:hypothetical protein